MNTKKVYQSITKIVESYKVKLATKTDEEFTFTPPIGGWSYSEVYSHIFDASLRIKQKSWGEVRHIFLIV